MPRGPAAPRRGPQHSVRQGLGSGQLFREGEGSPESEGKTWESWRGRPTVRGCGLNARGRSLGNLGKDLEGPRAEAGYQTEGGV